MCCHVYWHNYSLQNKLKKFKKQLKEKGNFEVKGTKILSSLYCDVIIEGAKESGLLTEDNLAGNVECK